MSAEKKARLKLFIIFSLFIGLGILAFGPLGYSQSAQKIKSQDELVREQMIEISRHLNVTCTECHKIDNFKSDSKPNFKIAKEHMRIVELLKTNGFDGKQGPLGTCYMCHRGELKPAFREGMKTLKATAKEPETKTEKKEDTPASH